MQFIKNFTAPNGATLTFHRITKIEADTREGTIRTVVSSWPTEAEYTAEKTALWNSYLTSAIPQELIDAALTATLATTEFSTGTVVADQIDTVDSAKTRKVAAMIEARNAATVAGFTVAGNGLASDAASQSRILAGVVAANANPSAFSEPWLLADGSLVTLTAAQMRVVAQTLFDHLKAQDARLYQRRQAIAAATTIPEVEAIAW